MASGGIALFYLAIAVAAIVALTGKLRMTPFLALIGVAIAYGLAIGLPAQEVISLVKAGFGGTLAKIGIVIVAGTVMGAMLDETGAALAMTEAILRAIGRTRTPLAMSAAGFVVSIPVFCDSGYVILNPLNKALAKESGTSMAVMAVALATGLYATHVLVPPTPGPLAAAAALDADLGKVILYGLIAAVPAALAGLAWAMTMAKRYDIEPDVQETYSEILRKYGKLPNAILSFLPIALPLLLIFLKAAAEYPTRPLGDGLVQRILSILGDPAAALIIGILAALPLAGKRMMESALSDWIAKGIKEAGPILAVTAAGGAFGEILARSPLSDFLAAHVAALPLGMVLPFAVSAAVKTAQGSSTVAIVTASGIIAPMMGSLALDPALTAVAVGAGSMVVSHANDSYFWVVAQFSGMPTTTAYKVYTSATAVEGIAALAAILVLNFFA